MSIALPDGWAAARRPALVAAALAGSYLLLAVLVATSVTAGLDAHLWTWFDRFDGPGAAHLVVRFIYRFGQFSLVLSVVAGASLLTSWRQRSWRPFVVAVGAMGVLDAVMVVFKYPLGRSYPHTGLNSVFGSGPSFEAFPSGHAAHATIGMLLLGVLITRLLPPDTGRRDWWGMRPWTVVLAGLLAFGAGIVNIVQGYHWATDVLGGWLVGLTMFVVAHTLMRPGASARPPADGPPADGPTVAPADRLTGR